MRSITIPLLVVLSFISLVVCAQSVTWHTVFHGKELYDTCPPRIDIKHGKKPSVLYTKVEDRIITHKYYPGRAMAIASVYKNKENPNEFLFYTRNRIPWVPIPKVIVKNYLHRVMQKEAYNVFVLAKKESIRDLMDNALLPLPSFTWNNDEAFIAYSESNDNLVFGKNKKYTMFSIDSCSQKKIYSISNGNEHNENLCQIIVRLFKADFYEKSTLQNEFRISQLKKRYALNRVADFD
jgi:hypothetical protein